MSSHNINMTSFPLQPSTCFSCSRLKSSTFLIVEDDQWAEQPFIYAKIYNHVVVLVDTGCGGAARDPSVELRSLRQFLETYPVPDNKGSPLNPGGDKAYAVVCTYCHYDHTGETRPKYQALVSVTEVMLSKATDYVCVQTHAGAIAQFTDQDKHCIWASANDKLFIQDDLPTTSLCRFVGMENPKYDITNWAADGEPIKYSVNKARMMPTLESPDLDLVIYHTPGHTPDELAVWDPQERFLFVGDTMYEWVPIIFPREGDLRKYTSTLYKLRDLIKSWNNETNDDDAASLGRVRMACGHVTSAADAEEFVHEVETFLSKVRRGLVEPQDKGEARGYRLVGYERDDGRVSFLGPKSLFEDFLVNDCRV